MAQGKSCILVPEVNGKDSKLYTGFLKDKKMSRPITNWVYSMYL